MRGIASFVTPYLELIKQCENRYGSKIYPGSPLIAALSLRAQDKSILVEKNPEAAKNLRAYAAHWPHNKVIERDGWNTLLSLLPPPERRGIVLIDPPYEATDEWSTIHKTLNAAWRKWPTGIYALWYPIKDREALQREMNIFHNSGVHKVLRLEVLAHPPTIEKRLIGTGMLIINPPWTLERDAHVILPELARILGKDASFSRTLSAYRVEWLVAP